MPVVGAPWVAQRVWARGARHVTTASLVSHSWAHPAPDVVALLSDALVLFPWDHKVYIEGCWQEHPELAEAIAAQQAHEIPGSETLK